MKRLTLTRKIITLLPLVIGLIISLVFIFFIGAESLVDYIGVQNAYVLMFLVAGLGGLSTFNSVPYLAVLFVLANTGVNPLWLGLTSALGVMCGDSFSFFLGKSSGTVIPDSFKYIFSLIKNLAQAHPKIFPGFCFLYGAVCPLSNDFVTIASGMAGIVYTKVMVPLALGNIVFNISFAYLCVYASGWLSGVLG